MVDDLLAPSDGPSGFDPRATRILVEHRADLTGELWMGGSYTAIGRPLHERDLSDAWLVDCAGELPESFRAAAAAHVMRVFEDLEWVPPSYGRIDELAGRLALALSGSPAADGAPRLPVEPPARIYVICKQGFNRSALVAGRILRALGTTGERAVAEIRRQRPGSLSNATFARLVQE